MSGRRPIADELVSTGLERAFLEQLRKASGEVDGPMERHGVRCFLLIERLAVRRGVEIDREVGLCAALVHDIGLYDTISSGGFYTHVGAEFAAGLFGEPGAAPRRIQLVADACAFHHALRDQSSRGTEVEFLRLADRIEVSGGLVPSGLSRGEVREVFAQVSRAGFYRGVATLLRHAARLRPTTLPQIFRLSH